MLLIGLRKILTILVMVNAKVVNENTEKRMAQLELLET